MVPFQLFLATVLVAGVWCFSEALDEEVEIGDPIHFFSVQHNRGRFVCPTMNGRFPHESDCSMFYECRVGRFKEMKCNRDQLYDAKSQQCNDRRRVNCRDKNDPGHDKVTGLPVQYKKRGRFVCPTMNGRFPHDSDCSMFYECRVGRFQVMKCNRDKLYDAKRQQCNDRRRVDCRDKNDHGHDKDKDEEKEKVIKSFRCPSPMGTFPHPDDCSKYFVCFFNIPSMLQCQGSNLFDEKSRKCLDKRRVKCGHRPDQQKKTTEIPTQRPTTIQRDRITTTETPTTKKDTRRYRCPFPRGRYADPEDCSQYYDCHWGVAKVYKCSRNMLYDERKEECAQDKNVKCGDRPGGIGGDKDEKDKIQIRCPYQWGIYPHPEDCSKYFICIFSVPTVYTCRKDELYHAKYRRCYPKDKVTCDYRINPDDLRSTTKSGRTTPVITTITTEAETTPVPTTTVETTIATETVTTPVPTTAEETTLTTEAETTPVHTTAEETTITTEAETTSVPTTVETTIITETTPVPTTAEETTITTEAETTPVPTTAEETTITTEAETTPVPTTAEETTITTEPETTPVATTAEETTITTVAETTAEVTTPEATTTKPTTLPSTPSVRTTPPTTTKPNTPPPTDCEEDDLDCIIDGTGDAKKWFECPERFGYFAHASSPRLFIHCDNYRPHVKVCGEGTVFSPKYSVCMWLQKTS